MPTGGGCRAGRGSAPIAARPSHGPRLRRFVTLLREPLFTLVATWKMFVDYDPRPAVVDYATAEQAEALVHESHGSNVVGEMAGLPASALEEVFASAAHVVSESIYQQAYAAVPMEGRERSNPRCSVFLRASVGAMLGVAAGETD